MQFIKWITELFTIMQGETAPTGIWFNLGQKT